MRLYVPPLRAELTLSKDWEFNIWDEYRNASFFDAFDLGKVEYNNRKDGPKRVMLPKGSILIIDRYYIRNGATAFDSVTFRLKSHGTRGSLSGKTFWSSYCSGAKVTKRQVRFWVKLADANNIEFEEIS